MRTPSTPERHARRFGFVLALMLTVAGALLWRFGPGFVLGGAWTAGRAGAVAAWTTAAIVAAIALVAPAAAVRVEAAWGRLGRAIGTAMTIVVFTVLFAVFLPLFLFVRLRDPLRKRLGAPTYWEPPPADEDTMERALRPF